MGAEDVIQVRVRRPGDENGWVHAQLRRRLGRRYPHICPLPPPQGRSQTLPLFWRCVKALDKQHLLCPLCYPETVAEEGIEIQVVTRFPATSTADKGLSQDLILGCLGQNRSS